MIPQRPQGCRVVGTRGPCLAQQRINIFSDEMDFVRQLSRGGLKLRRSPLSDLKQIFADNHRTTEVSARRINPHLVGDLWIVRWHEMREDQNLDASFLCHAAGIFG